MAEEVLKKALELGIAISASEEFIQMSEAQNRLDMDAESRALMAEFEETRALLETEDMSEARIEAVSARLAELQNDMLRSEIFSELIRAQNEFAQLMKKVNRTLSLCINGPDANEEEGCGGGCSSCDGCKH